MVRFSREVIEKQVAAMQHLPVDWYQGLFLRPHHFQALERYWAELIHTSHQWDFPFHYGLEALEFSPEALADYQLEVRRLHARMRDGTIVAFDTGQEPDRLDLREAMREAEKLEQQRLAVGLQQAFETEATIRVYLAIPRLKLGNPNVQTVQSNGDARYSRSTRMVQDDSRSGHEQEIQFRRVNARLLLSTQDPSGYEVLPIAQIKRAGDARARPQIDQDYIPPVISIDAWPGLGRDIVRAVYDVIGQKIDVLSQQVRERSIGFAATDASDLNRMMMLVELNGAHSALGALAFASGVHPMTAYVQLCQIAGRLAIFSDERRPEQVPPYDHEDLGPIFRLIRQRIEALILGVREYEYEQRFFVGVGLGMQVTLEPGWFHADWQWYIGVNKGELTEQECRDLLLPGELDWKLGSSRQVEILFKRRAEGLQLRPVGRVVRALPNRPDWIYYEVMKREGGAWRDVQETQTLAMRFKDSLIGNRDRLQGNRNVVVNTREGNAELQFALFAVPSQA
jgi:type VI secretion system protein ImpJ